jgi:hypothetical protein
MDWKTFYQNRINSTYQDYFNERYKVFIDNIKQIKSEADELFELGCGIGSVSKSVGGKFSGIDKDPFMVQLSNENTGTNNFVVGDIFQYDLNESVLKVSHGVLEHFSDEQIVSITNRCKHSIHYVPLDKYVTPSFGDERLLPYEHWMNLVNPVYYELFNDNHDLLFIL